MLGSPLRPEQRTRRTRSKILWCSLLQRGRSSFAARYKNCGKQPQCRPTAQRKVHLSSSNNGPISISEIREETLSLLSYDFVIAKSKSTFPKLLWHLRFTLPCCSPSYSFALRSSVQRLALVLWTDVSWREARRSCLFVPCIA